MNAPEIKLLSFDMDGTVVGSPDGTKRFRRSWEELAETNKPLLCYNSGRLLESTLELIDTENLPLPDYCICGVGTLIFDYGKQALITAFTDSLKKDWDPKVVQSIMRSFHGIVEQPEEFQNECKSSWYYYEAGQKQIEKIRKKLTQAGQDITIIYSSSIDLDVLPNLADKGNALMWLMKRLRILPEEVIVGGNTGNDRSMFEVPGIRGIVVKNAFPELIAATRDLSVFNASRQIADGIVEGLQYYGVFKPSPPE